MPCDVWACGVLFVTLLSGMPSTDPAAAFKHLQGHSAHASQLVQLATKMLARDPNERPTAQRVLHELELISLMPLSLDRLSLGLAMDVE